MGVGDKRRHFAKADCPGGRDSAPETGGAEDARSLPGLLMPEGRPRR